MAAWKPTSKHPAILPADAAVRLKDEFFVGTNGRKGDEQLEQLLAVQRRLASAENDRLKEQKLVYEELAKEREAHARTRQMAELLRTAQAEAAESLAKECQAHEQTQQLLVLRCQRSEGGGGGDAEPPHLQTNPGATVSRSRAQQRQLLGLSDSTGSKDDPTPPRNALLLQEQEARIEALEAENKSLRELVRDQTRALEVAATVQAEAEGNAKAAIERAEKAVAQANAAAEASRTEAELASQTAQAAQRLAVTELASLMTHHVVQQQTVQQPPPLPQPASSPPLTPPPSQPLLTMQPQPASADPDMALLMASHERERESHERERERHEREKRMLQEHLEQLGQAATSQSATMAEMVASHESEKRMLLDELTKAAQQPRAVAPDAYMTSNTREMHALQDRLAHVSVESDSRVKALEASLANEARARDRENAEWAAKLAAAETAIAQRPPAIAMMAPTATAMVPMAAPLAALTPRSNAVAALEEEVEHMYDTTSSDDDDTDDEEEDEDDDFDDDEDEDSSELEDQLEGLYNKQEASEVRLNDRRSSYWPRKSVAVSAELDREQQLAEEMAMLKRQLAALQQNEQRRQRRQLAQQQLAYFTQRQAQQLTYEPQQDRVGAPLDEHGAYDGQPEVLAGVASHRVAARRAKKARNAALRDAARSPARSAGGAAVAAARAARKATRAAAKAAEAAAAKVSGRSRSPRRAAAD